MSKLNHKIDSSNVFDGSFQPLPVGENIRCIITSSEFKTNSVTDETSLVLHIEAVDAAYKGCKHSLFLNLESSKDTIKRMAVQQLNSIAIACGIEEVLKNSEELHNIVFMVDTKETTNAEGKKFINISMFKNKKGFKVTRDGLVPPEKSQNKEQINGRIGESKNERNTKKEDGYPIENNVRQPENRRNNKVKNDNYFEEEDDNTNDDWN